MSSYKRLWVKSGVVTGTNLWKLSESIQYWQNTYKNLKFLILLKLGRVATRTKWLSYVSSGKQGWTGSQRARLLAAFPFTIIHTHIYIYTHTHIYILFLDSPDNTHLMSVHKTQNTWVLIISVTVSHRAWWEYCIPHYWDFGLLIFIPSFIPRSLPLFVHSSVDPQYYIRKWCSKEEIHTLLWLHCT